MTDTFTETGEPVEYLDRVEVTLTPNLGDGTEIVINGVPLRGAAKLVIDADIDRLHDDNAVVVSIELRGPLVQIKSSPKVIELLFSGTALTAGITDDTQDPAEDPDVVDAHNRLGLRMLADAKLLDEPTDAPDVE